MKRNSHAATLGFSESVKTEKNKDTLGAEIAKG